MTDDIKWDGSVYPYVAPPELTIDPRLRLHTDAETAIDPIVHELLRYALWNVNTEHGTTMIVVTRHGSKGLTVDPGGSDLERHVENIAVLGITSAHEDVRPAQPSEVDRHRTLRHQVDHGQPLAFRQPVVEGGDRRLHLVGRCEPRIGVEIRRLRPSDLDR